MSSPSSSNSSFVGGAASWSIVVPVLNALFCRSLCAPSGAFAASALASALGSERTISTLKPTFGVVAAGTASSSAAGG